MGDTTSQQRQAGQTRQKARRKKWLWGCAGGCAALVIILLIVIVVLGHYLLRRQPVLPPEAFLGPQADFFTVVHVAPDNKLAEALLERLAESLPPNAKRERRVVLSMWALSPFQLVLTARRLKDEGKFAFGGVGSVGRQGALIRWSISAYINRLPQEGGSTVTYKQVTIGVMKEGNHLAALDNNFMAASQRGIIEGWIDRIEELKGRLGKAEEGKPLSLPYDGPAALKGLYERLDPAAEVRFAGQNTEGQLKSLLEWLQSQRPESEGRLVDVLSQSEVDWSSVTAVAGTVRLLDADTAGYEIFIQYAAERLPPAVEERIKIMVADRAEAAGLKDIETTVAAGLLKLKFKKSGLQEAVRKAFAAPLARTSHQRGDGR